MIFYRSSLFSSGAALFLRRYLLKIVQIAVSGGLIFYLVTYIDWPRAAELWQAANKLYLLAAYLLMSSAIATMAWRWRILLKRLNIVSTFWHLWADHLLGLFYGIVLPGVIGGDMVRLASCARRTRQSLPRITASVFFERACGLLMVLLTGLLFAFLLTTPERVQLGPSLVMTFRIVAVGMLLGAGLTFFTGRHKKRWFLEDRFGVVQRIRELQARFTRLPKTTLFAILALSAMSQAIDIFAVYIVSQASHLAVPVKFFYIIVPMGYLITLLPVSLGGVGVREGVISFFLIRLGVPASDAVTMSFLIYLVRMAVAISGGGWQVILNRWAGLYLERFEGRP